MINCADIPLKSFAKIVSQNKKGNYCELKKMVSSGNIKLPKQTAIFNMGPATYCPSKAMGLCKAYSKKGKHICYAKKSENASRPNVLKKRLKQMKYWKNVTAEDFAWQFLLVNSLKAVPWKYLRFNESGDFWTQECLEKANTIAMILARYGIKTYCYTHRSDLDYTNIKHLIVSSSNFQDQNIPNAFYIVEDVKKEKPKGWSVCKGDCRICNKCYVRGFKVVIKGH